MIRNGFIALVITLCRTLKIIKHGYVVELLKITTTETLKEIKQVFNYAHKECPGIKSLSALMVA